MESHHYWIIVGIIFLIAEMGTPGGFLLASLGLGAFGGSLMAYLDFTFKVQLFAYTALTIIIFFTIRPFYLKYLQGSEADVGIGINAYIGQEYKVTETINNIDPKQKNENTFLFEFFILRFTTFEIKLVSF